MKRLLSIVFFVFILGCNSNENKKNTAFLDIKISPYNIPSENINFQYPYHVKGDSIFFFSTFSSEIISFSLIDFSLSINKLEFTDGFSPIKFHRINSDSIIFSDGATLRLFNRQGDVLKRISLFNNLNKIFDKVYEELPNDRFSSNLIYNHVNKSVLFYFANGKQANPKQIFAEISVENGNWNILDVYHPYSLKNLPLDYTTFPSLTVNNSGFSFLYIFSPIVSLYSRTEKMQKDFHIPSFEGTTSAEPQTQREQWSNDYFEDWVITSPAYLKLLYDEYRSVYYRISKKPLIDNRTSSEDYYTYLIGNQELIVTVLNEKFEKLVDFPLAIGIFDPSKAFVFSKGLWIPHHNDIVKDEEFIYGQLLTIE